MYSLVYKSLIFEVTYYRIHHVWYFVGYTVRLRVWLKRFPHLELLFMRVAEQFLWLIRCLLDSFACVIHCRVMPWSKCCLAGSFPNRRSEMYHDVLHIKSHPWYLLQNTKSLANCWGCTTSWLRKEKNCSNCSVLVKALNMQRRPLGWFGPTHFTSKETHQESPKN